MRFKESDIFTKMEDLIEEDNKFLEQINAELKAFETFMLRIPALGFNCGEGVLLVGTSDKSDKHRLCYNRGNKSTPVIECSLFDRRLIHKVLFEEITKYLKGKDNAND